MSLLMDALKRAEKARQEEDARKGQAQGGRDPLADTGGMSLDAPELSLEEIGDEGGGEIGEATIASTAGDKAEDPLVDFAPGAADAIGLSDSGEMRAVEEDILSGRASLDANLEDTADWELGDLQQAMESSDLRKSASLSMDYNEIPLDETSSTLPSMRAAQRSVDDYFDGTQSMSMSMEQIADPDASADGETTDQRFVDTTRRTAKALLEDGAPGRRPRPGMIAALVLIPLLLIVVGGGAFLFKDDVMALFEDKPRPIARRAPAPAPSPPVQPASESPGGAAGKSMQAPPLPAAASRPSPPILATTAPADVAPALSEAEQAAFVAAARALEATTPAPAAVVSGEIEQIAPEPESSTVAEVAEVSVAEVLDSTAGGAKPDVDLPSALAGRGSAAGLKITRRRGPTRIQRRLMEAYEAYGNGDDDAAAEIYERVLRARPNNRDAALGMAAIYLRSGAMQQALATYARILRRNPQDAAALSGLMAVQRGSDPGARESRLRSMLAEQPDDPQLYFSLGNVYAGQRRWPEAQGAYFNAFRLASDNPDYAFNLAVSLDQLKQSRAAAQYYRKAVELGESGRSTAFDIADASFRAGTLEQAR